MRKALIVAAAALFGMNAHAYAADIYGGSLKDAPVAYEAPTPVWAGLYVGGSVGFGVGDTSDKIEFDEFDKFKEVEGANEFIDIIEALLQSKYDVNGAIYGAHLGYNVQRGHLVYGAEVGLNGTAIDGSSPCVVVFNCSRELDWYATGVGRLGYAADNTLFYGFGGIAWGEVETEIGFISPALTFAEGEETHIGWTAGVGIEHALTDRLIVGIEYSHVDLGEQDTSLNIGGETIPFVTDNVDLEFDAVKVRASYKLSGGHSSLEGSK